MTRSRRRDRNAGKRAEARQHAREGRVEGAGYKGALGMVTMIKDPTLRVVFCNLAPEFRNAWCRTPGALYRRGLIPRLAAGLITFDAGGRCTV